MPTRKCGACGKSYPQTATVCGNCPDYPPVALVTGTTLDAELKVGLDLTQGTVIGTGNYTIDRVLGFGSFGVVYLATDGLNLVAIKELVPVNKPKEQKKRVELFLRESTMQEKVTKRVANKNLAYHPFPKGYGWFEAYDRLFTVMDYMDGMDLEKYIEKLSLTGPMPTNEAIRMVMEIALALHDYLHGYINDAGVPEPIIHRDIKPANIQRLSSGNACLLDFGIARFESYGPGTQVRGTRAGTPLFAAPEQVKKGGHASVRSDIFSLCATLFCLVTNEQNFPEHRVDQENEIIARIRDPQLKKLLLKGTQEDERARFGSALELGRELAKVYEITSTLPNYLSAFKPAVNPVRPATPRRPAPAAPVPTVATPVQPATPRPLPTPVQPQPQYTLVWGKGGTNMLNNNTQYRKDCLGYVYNVLADGSKRPVSNATVKVSQIVDVGHTAHNSTATITTDGLGLFRLAAIDTTVPVTVPQRTLYLEVKDSTGSVILGGSTTIKRPFAQNITSKAKKAYEKISNWNTGKVWTGISACLAVLFVILFWVGLAKGNPLLTFVPIGLIPLLFRWKLGPVLAIRFLMTMGWEGIALAIILLR